MKKSLAIALPFLFSFIAGAQTIEPSPLFRTGRLENGMTYYLYHNENPAGCADFYIAHNVGALQEEDSQNGLAHFLEHMAFNGLKHYPGKSMLEFLAKDGVRFGYNVNAFTSRKETVYNISSVPLVRKSFVDSVLLILHDWSCDISCEQQALDDERGVINEEWRLRDEPRYRMMCRQNELVYKGGKHPERTVLGSMDVINSFKREDILDFYHKWYRPDLQAIIITGDFDLDEMEAKVISKFSDIAMPGNAPRKPENYMPPRQDGPLFADMTDPTIKYQAIKAIYKQPYPKDRGCEEFFRDWFARQIVTAVLSSRFRERCKDKDCPAQSAVFVTSASAPEFYISLLTITPRSKSQMASSFEVCLREVKRMLDHGISEREFEVAKLNVLQKEHLDREIHPEDVKTDQISKICYHHFLDGKPLLDPVGNAQLMRRILDEVSYEFVSGYPAKMFSEVEAIYSNCVNEKELEIAIPHDRMKEIAASVAKENTEAQFLEYPTLDLGISAPAGRILKKERMGDAEKWSLSNGATVYFRQSPEFKSDSHFAMELDFEGGYRVFPRKQFTSGSFAASYLRKFCGFRGIERRDFWNYPELMGVSEILGFNELFSDIDVRVSGKKNIENAFRLVNLQLTEPYFPGEKHLEKEKAAALKSLGNKKNDKDKFKLKTRKLYFNDNLWDTPVDSTGIQAVDMTFVKDQYARSFGNFSGMKVYICSDLPSEQIEEYVCRYIVSLGKGAKSSLEKATPLYPAFKGVRRVEDVKPPVSAPLTDISYEFVWNARRSAKTYVSVQVLDYILSDRYLNLIREERGGAYHVDFSTDFSFNPKQPLSSRISFQTRPQLKDTLLKDIEDVMDAMCAGGPTRKEMETAFKYFKKRFAERKKVIDNSALSQLGELWGYVKYGVDYNVDQVQVLSTISAEDIQSLARIIAGDRRFISVYTEQ